MKKLFFCMLIGLLSLSAIAQETKKVEAFVEGEFLTSYVFRGAELSSKPVIQPVVGLAYGDFVVGIFASATTDLQQFEHDLFASYTTGNLTLTFTDYFGPFHHDDLSYSDAKPFDYGSGTNHLFEATIGYQFGKSPLSMSVNTLVGGAEYFTKDADGDRKYYTYVELNYAVNDNITFTAGGASGESAFYGTDKNDINVINLGVKTVNDLKIGEKKFPIIASFVYNPEANLRFITVGVGF